MTIVIYVYILTKGFFCNSIIFLWSEVRSSKMFGRRLILRLYSENDWRRTWWKMGWSARGPMREWERERENVRVARRARWQGGVEKEKERHGSRIVFAKYQYLRPPCWYLCSTRPNSTDLTQPIRPQLTPLCHPLFFPPPPPRLFTVRGFGNRGWRLSSKNCAVLVCRERELKEITCWHSGHNLYRGYL